MQYTEWNNVVLVNGLLIVGLYISSIGLVFYQQWFLQIYPFPLFVTVLNQLIKFIYASLYRTSYECCTGQERVSLTWKTSFRTMAALGLIGGVHTALSNWSLELNTVSLFTVSKSCSIIFILVFVIILGLEKSSWKIFVIVFMISFGLGLFTYKSVQFSLDGFLVAIAAAFMSGLRWTLAQYIFQKSDLGIENPIDLIYYVDLWVFIIILPFAVLFEGSSFILELCTPEQTFKLFTLLMGSATISFIMEITKYLVLCETSSLTVSVLGIVKEFATLIIAYTVAGDQITLINFFGLVLCLSGVIFHAVYKYKRAKKRHYTEITCEKGSQESISSSDDSTCTKTTSYFNLCNP